MLLKEKLALQNVYLIFLVASYSVHCEPTIAEHHAQTTMYSVGRT